MSNNEDNEIQVPESKKNEFSGFLKTLSTFTGDIYSLTCPSFLLSGVSTLEYGQYWADYPEYFAAIPQPTEELERAIAVLKWYISTLYGSFASRKDKDKIEKKPFNPILGEQFLARWDDRNGSGETTLVSEQVSHHPPISAIYLENREAGVSANGHTGQKSSFKATAARIDVIQVGHVIVRMRDHPEKYLITLPSLQILGLWRGAPYVELSGTSVIQSNNYNIIIEFSGKGWISGDKHTFHAAVRKNGSKESIYIASGTWSGKSTLENCRTNEKTNFLDIQGSQRADPIIAPEEDQNPLESRKLWKYVSQAIDSGDFATASKLKGEIEQRQRDKVKNGEETILQFFDWVEDQVFLNLDNLINHKYHAEEKYRETGSWVNKNLLFENNNNNN